MNIINSHEINASNIHYMKYNVCFNHVVLQLFVLRNQYDSYEKNTLRLHEIHLIHMHYKWINNNYSVIIEGV